MIEFQDVEDYESRYRYNTGNLDYQYRLPSEKKIIKKVRFN